MSAIIEVYRSGVEHVQKPDTQHSRPQLDFGPGFYLTDIYEQAVNWAIRRSNKFNKAPVINKYLLNQGDLLEEIGNRAHIFQKYDDEWLDFVVSNRQGLDSWQVYDYIEGGVADDRVVNTIDLYMTGFLSRQEALDRLKYLKPNNQICISKQDLLDKHLVFIDSMIIDKP